MSIFEEKLAKLSSANLEVADRRLASFFYST